MPRRKQVASKEIHADWWDNEVVVIRSITGAENDWIQDRTSSITPGQGTMDVKIGTTQRLTLIYGIQSWNFTDADNKPLPWPPLSLRLGDNAAIIAIREKSLEHVFTEDRQFIFTEIEKLAQPMTDEEKKDSSNGALNGLQDSPVMSLTPLSTTT